MAVKRDFGVEKQSSDLKGRTGSQNAKTGKTENVDALVSRFLAELTDLSSEMSHADAVPAESQAVSGPRNGKIVDSKKLQPQMESPADVARINREIEESLAELETLRPAFGAPHKMAPPVVQEKPAVPEKPAAAVAAPKPEAPRAPVVKPPAPIASEEQAGKNREIFAVAKPAPRFSITWVLAGAVLLGVLGVAGFYFLGSDRSTPATQNERPAASAKMAEPAGQIKEAPAARVIPPESNAKKTAKVADSAKAAAVSKAKPATKSTETAKNQQPASVRNGAASGPESKRQTESANQATPSETPAAEEQPKTAAAPPAAVTTPPPQPQPKTQPQAAENGSANAGAAAAVRETPPPAPKPAAASSAPEVNAQPKPSIALQAEPVKRVSPVYPALARSRKISGVVDVEAEINDSGDVIRAKAVSGPPMLRPAAEEALIKWKFKPASVNGVNIASKARISVNFSLQ